jgi:hypothetical protein
MSYRDPDKQREYQRQWKARRRAEFFADKECVRCGFAENLELDHIDPRTKIGHGIWSWSQKRREEELAKCQVLCRTCHEAKSIDDMPVTRGFAAYKHGTLSMYRNHGCRCDLCKTVHRENFRHYRKLKRLRSVAVSMSAPQAGGSSSSLGGAANY